MNGKWVVVSYPPNTPIPTNTYRFTVEDMAHTMCTNLNKGLKIDPTLNKIPTTFTFKTWCIHFQEVTSNEYGEIAP